MKPILSTAFLCLILLFYSCEKTEDNADYTVLLNNTFTIELTANHSTGYSWHWNNDERIGVVDSLTTEYIEQEGRGKEGEETWTFITKKKGTEKLIFEYKRINETTIENKREILINVQ